MVDCIQRDLSAQVLWPVRSQLQAGMLQVLHDQNQRGRRLAPGNGADHLLRLLETRTAAAQSAGNRQGEQVVFMQQAKIVVGEFTAGVVALCGGGQSLRDALKTSEKCRFAFDVEPLGGLSIQSSTHARIRAILEHCAEFELTTCTHGIDLLESIA